MNQNPFDDFQNKPPIPSPHGEVQLSQKSSGGILAYAPMIAIGLGVFAVLMALSFVVNILFVGIAIIATYVVMAIIATEKIKALGAKLNYTVRTREDLREVSEVIDLNMKLAFILMAVLFPLIAVAILKSAYVCTALIAVASFSLTPYTMGAEKRFKAMKVDAFDTEIAAKFEAMIARWKEPKFGLEL